MIAFIHDHRETYGVEPIRKMLPTAPRPTMLLPRDGRSRQAAGQGSFGCSAKSRDPARVRGRGDPPARPVAVFRGRHPRMGRPVQTRRLPEPIGTIPPGEAEARDSAQTEIQTLAAWPEPNRPRETRGGSDLDSDGVSFDTRGAGRPRPAARAPASLAPPWPSRYADPEDEQARRGSTAPIASRPGAMAAQSQPFVHRARAHRQGAHAGDGEKLALVTDP